MSVNLKIEVSEIPSVHLTSRFRNFGEDVWRELKALSAVSLDEIDRAETCFHVPTVHPRDLAKVLPIIHHLLRTHGFAETATITRIKEIDS